MNTMGRILVVLNLLFALITGGFLVVDFATRRDWKKAYQELERELKVAKQNGEVLAQSRGAVHTEMVQLEKQLATKEDELKKLAVAMQAKIDAADVTAGNAEKVSEQALLAKEQLQGENERLREELVLLRGIKAEREKRINTLIGQKDQYYSELQNALNEKTAALIRNDSLLKRIRELELDKARTSVAGADTGSPVSVGRNDSPNPPTKFLKGVIERVHDSDKTLVQISIGSDDGLSVGHTLQSYRLRPQPKYLGQIRIVEVDHHHSVGRVMLDEVQMRSGPPSLRPGDEVASSLQQN